MLQSKSIQESGDRILARESAGVDIVLATNDRK
jgi:hypothetical protein